MNRTATQFYRDERRRMEERRDELERRIGDLHMKLTEATRERLILDDLILRLSHHLPETDDEIVDESDASVTPLPRAAAGGGL